MHGGAAERRAVEKLRLWQVWWIGGAALAALTAALVWAAERAYSAGNAALGDLASVARILLYLLWCRAVWRASRNVERAFWTPLALAAAALGLLASAALY